MKRDMSTFTHEYLSSLKFKELQKLSVEFQVNKRWAKKHELIENLLAIKNQSNLCTLQANDDEWKDGSVVFQTKETTLKNDIDRRLTFNVEKPNPSNSRLTFDVPPKENSLTDKNKQVSYSRDTYEIPPKSIQLDLEDVIDPRATYEIAQNGRILMEESTNPRATYEIAQNGRILMEESTNPRTTFEVPKNKILRNNLRSGERQRNEKNKLKVSSELQKQDNKSNSSDVIRNLGKKISPIATEKEKDNVNITSLAQVKMLTIPYSRVSKRNKKEVEHAKSPIAISKKSINIKKSRLPTKLDTIKSPRPSRKPSSRRDVGVHVTNSKGSEVSFSKIPTILPMADTKLTKPHVQQSHDDKENAKCVLPRKKSKTADEVLAKKSNIPKVSFMSPPVSLNTKHQVILPIKKTPINKEIVGRTPGKTVQASTPSGAPKTLTASKMPNFSKIHQRQFEQMDSLHDYIKKKEERARKLFGTPQHGNIQKNPSKSSGIFRFQSSLVKPESKFVKSSENFNIKTIQKEAVKNKLPPSKLQTDIKNKNRTLINGVRTNKRFELQMKLRKI